MADIELVIKISEAEYDLIINDEACGLNVLTRAIANGTPLPKGHGRLIDADDLLEHYDSTTYHNGIEERKIHFVQIGYVNDAPTIIEADKVESEGKK